MITATLLRWPHHGIQSGAYVCDAEEHWNQNWNLVFWAITLDLKNGPKDNGAHPQLNFQSPLGPFLGHLGPAENIVISLVFCGSPDFQHLIFKAIVDHSWATLALRKALLFHCFSFLLRAVPEKRKQHFLKRIWGSKTKRSNSAQSAENQPDMHWRPKISSTFDHMERPGLLPQEGLGVAGLLCVFVTRFIAFPKEASTSGTARAQGVRAEGAADH